MVIECIALYPECPGHAGIPQSKFKLANCTIDGTDGGHVLFPMTVLNSNKRGPCNSLAVRVALWKYKDTASKKRAGTMLTRGFSVFWNNNALIWLMVIAVLFCIRVREPASIFQVENVNSSCIFSLVWEMNTKRLLKDHGLEFLPRIWSRIFQYPSWR